MNMELFERDRGIESRHIVPVVKELAPKYDKHLHSKVKKVDDYSVQLIPEIERLLYERFPEGETKKQPVRRLTCRVYTRMTKVTKEALQRAFEADGYASMQEGMVFLATQYLEGRREK